MGVSQHWEQGTAHSPGRLVQARPGEGGIPDRLGWDGGRDRCDRTTEGMRQTLPDGMGETEEK